MKKLIVAILISLVLLLTVAPTAGAFTLDIPLAGTGQFQTVQQLRNYVMWTGATTDAELISCGIRDGIYIGYAIEVVFDSNGNTEVNHKLCGSANGNLYRIYCKSGAVTTLR